MNPVDISLYGIVDPERSLGRPLDELAKISAENGVTLIQYRDKKNDIRKMIGNAEAIRDALAGTGVPLIINDRVDVALASGADGVHLGQQDMTVEHARKLLGPDAIIGLSIKTVEEAEACPVDTIDYAFVGGVFITQSKDNPTAIGIDGWMERANIIKNKEPDIPIGAIAGIDASNAQQLVDAGCDGIAVISSIYMAEDVAIAANELSGIMKGANS
ncbi:MAG: thiamine phosphate synthase [Pseudomonadota bacterium]